MDMPAKNHRFEVQEAVGPLDESEVERVRKRVLAEDCFVNKLEERVRAQESKTGRIWYILTVIGFLAWAWIDGRFGFTAPNAQPITPAAVTATDGTEEVSVLANQDA